MNACASVHTYMQLCRVWSTHAYMCMHTQFVRIIYKSNVFYSKRNLSVCVCGDAGLVFLKAVRWLLLIFERDSGILHTGMTGIPRNEIPHTERTT